MPPTTVRQQNTSTTVPLDSQFTGGLVDALVRQAVERPESTAVIHDQATVSYDQLCRRSAAIAEQLLLLGVKKGDKVGLLFPNHHEFVACFFGILRVGAVIVPVNPLLKSDEIAHIISDSGATAFIVHAVGLNEVSGAIGHVPNLKHIVLASDDGCETLPTVLDSIGVPTTPLTSAAAPSQPAKAESIDANNDLALIMYTSGTTGKPKGAMLSHGNLMAVVPEPLLQNLSIGPADRCLGVLPFCHIYGVSVIIFGTVSHGAAIVVLQKFDAKEVLETIARHGVTLLPAVPTMYHFMLMELAERQYDISSIRLCFSGAAPLSTQLFSRVKETFKSPVIEGYGLTETACGATLNPLAAPKIGSVGTALNGICLKIAGSDGQPLPVGESNVGEIAIKGNNIMLGYHNKSDATAECMQDGWFFTGDLGYQDAEGYFYIVGRAKELIIRGGQNIYPREIEEVIVKLPAVLEVAVIGVPDELMGERVKAIVFSKPNSGLTEESVKAHCAKHLAPYKVPRLVEFRMEPLPRNSTGKVLKRLLT